MKTAVVQCWSYSGNHSWHTGIRRICRVFAVLDHGSGLMRPSVPKLEASSGLGQHVRHSAIHPGRSHAGMDNPGGCLKDVHPLALPFTRSMFDRAVCSICPSKICSLLPQSQFESEAGPRACCGCYLGLLLLQQSLLHILSRPTVLTGWQGEALPQLFHGSACTA